MGRQQNLIKLSASNKLKTFQQINNPNLDFVIGFCKDKWTF